MIDWTMFLRLDSPAFASGALAAVACAIIGCFLVLRRMSLMGDAISHAVLPGIVGAYVLADSLAAAPVFIGCALVGVVTALLTEVIHRLGRVEEGASMGVVFTVLFAIGVIWLEQLEGGRGIHLDAECVLYGAMEGVIWPTAPEAWGELSRSETWSTFPRQVTTLALVLLANLAFIGLFFKELRITSFDPGLAGALGFRPALMHYLLMTFVAMTTVAAFEAVGSILVVAMLIVPGVSAHLLTNRLGVMILLSAAVAMVASVSGYATAAATGANGAGMIGLALGGVLAVVGLLSPQHGWLSRLIRRQRLGAGVMREDMLGLLYRVREVAPERAPAISPAELRRAVGGGLGAIIAWWQMRRRDEARLDDGRAALTPAGAARAAQLVRSHRLWESYLVDRLGFRPDHVHATAMELEHVTTPQLQEQLAAGVGAATTDPHGRAIPASTSGAVQLHVAADDERI